MRIYNPSLGKFLSVDPLAKKYPELTPYQFANNTPIMAIDLDGLENMTAIEPLVEPTPVLAAPRPSGGNVSRGISGVPIPETPIETNNAPYGHSNLKDLTKYVWFDANGHPQTNLEPKKTIQPINDPLARQLQSNLIKTKLEDSKNNSDENNYIYRAMGVGADGKPQIPFNPNPLPNEVSGKMLGVRPQDIAGLLNGDGTVSPGIGKGGMSVSDQYHAEAFAPHIAVDILAGKRAVFKILKTDLINSGFILEKDGPTHISVQPGETMKVEDFQKSILKTRDKWTPK